VAADGHGYRALVLRLATSNLVSYPCIAGGFKTVLQQAGLSPAESYRISTTRGVSKFRFNFSSIGNNGKNELTVPYRMGTGPVRGSEGPRELDLQLLQPHGSSSDARLVGYCSGGIPGSGHAMTSSSPLTDKRNTREVPVASAAAPHIAHGTSVSNTSARDGTEKTATRCPL